MALPFLIGLLVTLLFVLTLREEEPVARLEAPTIGPRPEAPATEPQAGTQTDSQTNSQTNSQASTGATRIETELTGSKTGPLRSELEGIAQAYPANYGVVIFDPSTGETVTMGADQSFLAASLTKLPVLMTLYRAAAGGAVDLEDKITMQASDVQAYGTGVLFTYPVGYTMTLRECATLLIKESDNTAWKMLDRYLGRAYIRNELYSVGAHSTQYWLPNTTTPNDVLIMLEKISDPAYTTPDLSAEMLDLMTNTSFEDRLPQPLPQGLRVSHKIGSYGSTFSDAGIVFPEGSHDARDAYYIVVIASDTSEWTARAAMREMSLATYRTLSNSPEVPSHKTSPSGS